MSDAEIEARLAGPHMCVFSVARLGKGPVAIPKAGTMQAPGCGVSRLVGDVLKRSGS